jgi:anti-anti-sigma regulatory factor
MRACWTNILEVNIWQLCVDGPCLDVAQVERIRVSLHSAISTTAQGVVIDLQRVDRLDPLGLAGLASLPREFSPRIRIVLAGLRYKIQELALLLHLHDIFDIYEDARAAAFDMSVPIHQHRGFDDVGHE